MSTTVAVLGTGIMGAGMTRSLLREGLEVTVWNRSTDKAKPLADDGARVARDGRRRGRRAPTSSSRCSSTPTPWRRRWSRRLAALPRRRGVGAGQHGGHRGHRPAGRPRARRTASTILDAPMLGTKAPAENGQLVVLASGPSSLRETVAPVFDAIGSRTQWVSETLGDASRLKLAVNAWIGVMVNGIAQSIALARGLGLDPQQFLDAVDGGA